MARKVQATKIIDSDSGRLFFMVPASKRPWIRAYGIHPDQIDQIEMDVYLKVKFIKGHGTAYRYSHTIYQKK